jgi:hypothetical protein
MMLHIIRERSKDNKKQHASGASGNNMVKVKQASGERNGKNNGACVIV